MKKSLLSLSVLVLMLSACEQRSEPPAPAPAPTAAPAPEADSTPAPASEAAAAPDGADSGPLTRFTAFGFSPAWQANVDGEELEFDVPETTGVDQPLRRIAVERSAYAKGVTFEGKDGDVAVSLDIRSGPCDKATEDDKPREFFATLTYGNSTYKGCADAPR
ncbi:MAG: hypothetical protein Q4G70_05550 [Pseudomonadota bacterium]|nr:hypothetical protein [Pseudomonadota bacterium]